MKIQTFQIHNYGHVSQAEPVSLENFVLFTGGNEDGKTLMLDALIRMLVRRYGGRFERLGRIEYEPDGYIVLRTSTGDEIRFPDTRRRDLPSILDISPETFLNLFVVRDSDLQLPKEAEFYGDVTEHLTGLQKKRIERIAIEIRSLARITEGGSFKNQRDTGKLRERIETAQDLITKCDDLSAELREQRLDLLEKDLVETEEEIKTLQTEIEELELARQEYEYKTYQDLLQKFQKGNKSLRQYENITQDDLSIWKTQQGEIEQQHGEERKNQDALKEYRGELKKLKAEKENHVSVRDAKQTKLTNCNPILNPILDTHAKVSETLSRATTFKPSAIKGSLGLGIIFVVVFLAYLLEPLFLKLIDYSSNPRVPVLLVWIVGGLFIIALAFLVWWAIVLSSVNRISQRLLIKATDYGFEADTVTQLRTILSKFGEQLQQHESLVRQSEDDVRSCMSEIQGIERELERLKGRRNKLEEMISDIRRKSIVETLEDYMGILVKKQKVIDRVNNAQSLLTHRFGDPEGPNEKKEEFWQGEIENLKPERSPRQIYDEMKLNKAKEKQQELREEEERIRQSLKNSRETLSQIEADVNEVLSPFLEESGKIIIESSNDIEIALTRLDAFVKEAEDRRDNALIAIKVLDSLAKREEERVSSLFGEESDVSKVFSSFTHGDYTAVRYISDKQAIEVDRRDGITLEPWKLSGGTYDQLYLAIRVALAKQVLGEDQGFFLFDDPFVKSDPVRLRIQISNLLELVQNGWQVIYFSTKPEVREELNDLLNSSDFQIVELPPAPFKQDPLS